MVKNIKKDAKIRVDKLEYGQAEAEIEFDFGGKLWTIEHFSKFSSPKAAENQVKKLAEKLGFNITDCDVI